MNKLLLNIVSFSMIVSVMFAVMGLPLQYHTCGITGERIMKVIEKPECACEAEPAETTSCCHEETVESNNCSSEQIAVPDNNNVAFKELDCCQNEVFLISLNESFVSSIVNNANVVSQISGFISAKLRFDEYKCELNQAKTLQKMPRDIILELIHILHRSDNRDTDHNTTHSNTALFGI